PNLQSEIAILRAALADPGVEEDVKSYDLTWLLHLVGDVHQPLHCTSRFDHSDPSGDQGGNLVVISGASSPSICDDPRYCPYGPPTELHAFYDDITGSSSCLGEVEAAAATLPKPKQKDAAIGDEVSWVQESFALAQNVVYAPPIGVGDGPFTLDETYQKAALSLGRQRISLAGTRLANLLNESFAKESAH
ncbi:MAG TPA: S1/P1 nuclease, partial [Polyangiales bacterium]